MLVPQLLLRLRLLFSHKLCDGLVRAEYALHSSVVTDTHTV